MATLNPKRTAKLLKALRVGKGKTQAEIAKICGVTRTAIHWYETGARTVNDKTKVKLAKYYGVTVGYLFYGEK